MSSDHLSCPKCGNALRRMSKVSAICDSCGSDVSFPGAASGEVSLPLLFVERNRLTDERDKIIAEATQGSAGPAILVFVAAAVVAYWLYATRSVSLALTAGGAGLVLGLGLWAMGAMRARRAAEGAIDRIAVYEERLAEVDAMIARERDGMTIESRNRDWNRAK